MEPLIPASPAHDRSGVPIYKLWGYGNVWTVPDPLFCETIAEQEKLHHWHVTPHKHVDLFQILFLETGGVTTRLDGESRTHGPGRMVLVPQMVVHEFLFEPDSSGYILTLTYALLRQMCRRFSLGLCADTRPAVLELDLAGADAALVSALHELNREYHSPPSPQRGPLLEAILAIILVWVQRCHHPERLAEDGALQAARHLARYTGLVEQHFREQHQVRWYAGHLGITPAHLNLVVRTKTGKTALQLIHERLLLEARRDLMYTPLSINEVAETLGFIDPGHFSRFFKRLCGVTAREFRRHHGRATVYALEETAGAP